MLTTSTPETVNPVSDACEAAGVPCLSTVMPWEAWYFGRGAKPNEPSPFKWTYHFSFGVKNFLDCYVSQWSALPTNKKLGVLYPNDADGNAIREHLAPALAKAGYIIVDPGGYEDGTTDFAAQIAKFKAEKCEVFNTFPIPPDFAAFWRQAAQQGYTKIVKIAQIAKTGLFPSQIEALGSLGNKLAGACYWHPDFPYNSPLTGISSKDIAEGYEKAVGKQWNMQIGASMSLFDAGFAALKNSGAPNDKSAVAKALAALKTITMVGIVDFTSGPFPNVSPSSIIGTQWIKAKPGVVRLSAQEREQLQALVRKGKGPARRLLKARILLKADVSEGGPGWSDSKIIAAFDTSASMLYRVRKQLVEEGFETVLSRKQRATPAVARIFDGEKEAKLIALACSKPPKGRARWTLRLLENKVVELGIVDRASNSTIHRTLKKTVSNHIAGSAG